MILHCASSELAARARTGILASLFDARSGTEALRAVGTLRPTIRRTADVVRRAGARRMRADHFALRVRAARIRRARIPLAFGQRRRRANLEAVHEGITGVAVGAAADRIVIHRKAIGILAARARTRVRTLIVYARFVLRALGADDAARSAGRWDASESWLTQAHRVSVLRTAVAVGSAGRRVARIDRQW